MAEYEALAALARLKNFRAAARELGVSPPALSSIIAGLEARLGVRLFNRTTRSVSMTEAGEQFAARITPALADIDAAIEAVNGHRQTPAGALRINTNALAARQVMPIVAEYLRRYPQMKVEITTDNAFVDIVAGGFDAGIRLADALPKDMIGVPIERAQRRFVVGSAAYFQDRPLPQTPKDLLAHQCVVGRLGGGSIWRWVFEHQGARQTPEVQGPIILDEPNAMRDAAVAGIGLAYLNEALVADDLAAGRLVQVLGDWTPPYPGNSLYYPGRRHVPAGLRAFINLIRELSRSTA